MKWGAVVFFAALATSVLAAGITQTQLEQASNAVAGVPQLKEMLGSSSLILLEAGSERIFLQWDGQRFSKTGGGTPDFTISASEGAVRSLINADDKSRAAQCLLSQGAMVITARDFFKQAGIKAGLAAYVKCAPPVFFHNKLQTKFENDAKGLGLFFARKPGALARNPNLIYDTVSNSPNAVGPWNIFKVNPGLVGPNQILSQNPGLIGPADMAIINPNLHGPAEFAHLLGIGAHSNSVRALENRGLLNLGPLSPLNRWGNKR